MQVQAERQVQGAAERHGQGGVVASLALGQVLQEARVEMTQLDHCIRKLVQNNNRNSFQNGNARSGQNRQNRNSFFNDSNKNRNQKEDNKQSRKRPQETKTVFSRLSTRRNQGDSDNEEEMPPAKKPRIPSQVIRDLPTKQEVMKAQTGDEVSKARNRRMFGSLLGTLQKFKQEEIILKNKEDKKAQIEQKIENQAKQERENQKKERQTLFAQREIKKATIKALETKMARTLQFEKWETTQKPLNLYIFTKAKPSLYWLPKKMSEAAQEKLDDSKKKHEEMLERKRAELANDLQNIEQRCLRNAKIPADVRPASLADVEMQLDNEEEEVKEGQSETAEVADNDDKKKLIEIKQEGERKTRTGEHHSDDESEEEDNEESSSSSEDDEGQTDEEPLDATKNPKKEKNGEEDAATEAQSNEKTEEATDNGDE